MIRATRVQRYSAAARKGAKTRARLAQENPARRSQRRKPTVPKHSQKTEPDGSTVPATDPTA